MDGMKQDHLHNQGLSIGGFSHDFGACTTQQTNASMLHFVPKVKIHSLTSEDKLKQKNICDFGIPKLHGGVSSTSCNFDSLLSSMIKAVRNLAVIILIFLFPVFGKFPQLFCLNMYFLSCFCMAN
jgi:two-component response regulator (ARR-B family)